ncbi:hypothetical protein D0O17_24630 [Salmonella enterica]|nr:hypothetical protein [Salmonella enterica]EBN7715283.1 hypothetical protein [Salmonella enterica]
MQKPGVASAVHILLIQTASGKFCPMKIAVPREPPDGGPFGDCPRVFHALLLYKNGNLRTKKNRLV